MPRWLLILSSCFALAVACDRADREIFPFQPAKTSSASGSQNTFDGAGGGGEGGVGGQGGAGGQGGLGGGSFCDGPDVTCQECAQCLLGTDCSLPFSECDGQAECGEALDCLRDCRDGCFNDPTCLEGCIDSCQLSAPGFNAALDVLDCFCRLGCPNACEFEFSSECISFLP